MGALCVGLLLLTVFVWLLLFQTRGIARLISKPADRVEDIRLFAERRTMYAIALVLLGLITVVWAVPDFVVQLKNYFSLVRFNQIVGRSKKMFMLTAAIKLVLGIFAIVYAEVIADFLAPESAVEE